MIVEDAEDAEQRVIVKSVSREDRDLAAAVLVGYIILSVFVDGVPLASPLTSVAVQSLLAEATVGHPVQVSFGKPLPLCLSMVSLESIYESNQEMCSLKIRYHGLNRIVQGVSANVALSRERLLFGGR